MNGKLYINQMASSIDMKVVFAKSQINNVL
jgi:hypothetical protein